MTNCTAEATKMAKPQSTVTMMSMRVLMGDSRRFRSILATQNGPSLGKTLPPTSKDAGQG